MPSSTPTARSTSTWGALRAKNGHPAPFNLKYMEIGNENGGPAYQERYALFYDAIKAKYPQMHLVANEWSGSADESPGRNRGRALLLQPGVLHQQCATSTTPTTARAARSMWANTPSPQGCGQGNLRAAVGEAAFMTGLERNSDVVVMASYAPLFANVNYKKWNPDLIDFDSARAYGIPSYYVQQMFSAEPRRCRAARRRVTAPESAPARRSGGDRRRHLAHTGRVQGHQGHARRRDALRVRFRRRHERLEAAAAAIGRSEDGALRQKALAENVRAFAGDKAWNNYTYSLKARKLGGAEGFLIPFLVKDENAKSWWNIGGWGNTRHAHRDGRNQSATDVPGSIETGRWYDIRIEVKGANVKCYLDGKLIHDVKWQATKPLYAVGQPGQSRPRGDPEGRERLKLRSGN